MIGTSLGQEVCHQMVLQTMGGELHDPALQQKAELAVDSVANSFIDLQVEPRVMASENPNATVCATGEKSGRVYFTKGLLDTLNEDELTFIAAHEVGHLKLHNHSEDRDLHQSELEADVEGLRALADRGIDSNVAETALIKAIGLDSGESATHPSLQIRLDSIPSVSKHQHQTQ